MGSEEYEDPNIDRIIAEETARICSKDLRNLDKTEKRMKVSGGTIGHELNEAQDRVDWWAQMGRFNPFKAEVKGKKVKVTKKKVVRIGP